MISTTTKTPWTYYLLRLFLQLVLETFYGNIIVENTHLIPGDGRACIICANHDNSVTDAPLLVTSIPLKTRSMLRTTAKSTHFGKKTFVSWLIESIGAIPVKRRVDFTDAQLDNTDAMVKLYEALEAGEAVSFFPEGISRYHPCMAPMKTGVARIVSQVLTRNSDKPNFEISIVPCSITYMNRQYFRSDVLVSFQPPMRFTPQKSPELIEPVDFSRIRALTATIEARMGAGTLHAPSWGLVRNAKMAAQIYAPLGTTISLGDHVRIIKVLLEVFRANAAVRSFSSEKEALPPYKDSAGTQREKIRRLCGGLKDYKDELLSLGVPDYRLRRPLGISAILGRMALRLFWSTVLLTFALPGLVLWLPVFSICRVFILAFKRTGTATETEVRIAHTSQLSGVFGIGLVLSCTLLYELFRPSGMLIAVPLVMWVTLHWLDDGLSSLRAFIILSRLLLVDSSRLHRLHITREELRSQVMELALHTIGLPADPAAFFAKMEHRPGDDTRTARVSEGGAGTHYFSRLLRKKKDWNDVFGLWQAADYPEDGA